MTAALDGSGWVNYDSGYPNNASSYGYPDRGSVPAAAGWTPPSAVPTIVGPAGTHAFVELPGSSRVMYDAGYPGSVQAVVTLVDTHGDNPNPIISTQQDTPLPDVNIRRYIDTSTGGRTGVVSKNGYSTGLRQWWNGGIGVTGAFTGRTKRFVTRDLTKDTGPVGRSNYMGQLQSAVASQYHVPPTLEDIYRSLTGMGDGSADQ